MDKLQIQCRIKNSKMTWINMREWLGEVDKNLRSGKSLKWDKPTNACWDA